MNEGTHEMVTLQGFVMTDGEIVHLLLTLGAREDEHLDFAMFLQLCLNQAQVLRFLLFTWTPTTVSV